MAGFQVSTEIEAPIEMVREFVDKPENELLWQSNAIERQVLTEGPIDKGTRIRLVDRFLGVHMESEWEIVEHHPYYRADRTVSGPIHLEASWRLEPVENGTLFAMGMEAPEGAGGFFGKLTDPVVLRIARRDFEANLAKLKDLIEAEI
ncbi:MAG: SRPBCC family protein [Acidimicrobiia bacterium]|nr:SRPBCC family protein [Acidimicrobiia bacterium]MDH5616246.1 SRPBCC family protein [Acidimicrobiia bacterium]